MSTKLDHEKAVDEFLEIDQKYTTLETQFMSGELLTRVMEETQESLQMRLPRLSTNSKP